MEKLTIEEKARRYDEAIEKGKQIQNTPYTAHWDIMKEVVEHLFPGLQESEDERIRKYLISFVELNSGVNLPPEDAKKILAWLEKQGEYAKFRDSIQVGDKVTRNQDGVLVNLSQLKRVAKPADKVEPKFHEGDWINGYYTNYKVLSVNDKGYVVEDVNGNKINILFENEKFHHLWTIQDAKDGDVLAAEEDGETWIGIFKELDVDNTQFFSSYCQLPFGGSEIEINIDTLYSEGCHPATKEQRDLLFQKMRESGYKWDAEKKELKKIEQNHADEVGNYDHKKVLQTIINEQKPTDKVEPKFKAGDIITNGKIIGKVDENENNKYHGWFGYDKDISVHYADIPDIENWHLWTIQDAKEGDVLVYNDGSLTIFRYRLSGLDAGLYMSHVLLTDKIEFKQTCVINNVQPATKEQRDLLFQKMKDAGYEWDAEKKELRKIEQRPTVIFPKFRVGDEIKTANEEPLIITKIDEKGYWSEDLFICDFDEECIWDLVEQKPAWSEDDENMLNHIIIDIESLKEQVYCKYLCNEEINWLKSIKDRILPQNTWKPSDEQMHYLSWIANVKLGDGVVEQEVSKHLNELLEDLKKLKKK